MSSIEYITGEKVAELIEELILLRTLVKISIPGSDYERLTLIIRFRRHGRTGRFEIDPPEGIQAAVAQIGTAPIQFEFTSENKLPHRFQAHAEPHGKRIWVDLPKRIQRYQLRNNFRIKAPSKAHCTFEYQEIKVRTFIDNISLGGALCHCPITVKSNLAMHQTLENLHLFFSFGGEQCSIDIASAEIVRIEKRARPKHFGLAVKFLQMDAEVEKQLTKVVYDLQRDFLKSRLKID
ncbi:MAG: PilZ domain-containing protein [Desulfatitalea sp.]|nr:PilZ domain-containing protein [Desulfatitalea sp.]